MLRFIIRLDDACPWMIKDKWDRMEAILERYGVRPIVGIIPDCKDKAFLKNPKIDDFWEKYAMKWQKKNWIIALHGLNHDLDDKIRTEFVGKDYNTQVSIIEKGINILKSHQINPTCFFAPNHTFDKNTIKACKKFSDIKFISDGYAFFPYSYKKMIFVPSVFDTPHIISNNGIFTFVFHPNNMLENDFDYLEKFLKNNFKLFDIDIFEILDKFANRKRNITDRILHLSISIFRITRKALKGE